MMFVVWVVVLTPVCLLVWGVAWALSKWRGLWKFLAAIPALVFAWFAFWLAWDLSQGSTDRNIWPIEVAYEAFWCLVLFALIVVARALFGRPDAK